VCLVAVVVVVGGVLSQLNSGLREMFAIAAAAVARSKYRMIELIILEQKFNRINPPQLSK
jgi:hypothetical protein